VLETGAHAEQGDALFQGSAVSPQKRRRKIIKVRNHDMVVEFITCQCPELVAYHVSFFVAEFVKSN